MRRNITTKVTDTSDSASEPSAQPSDEPPRWPVGRQVSQAHSRQVSRASRRVSQASPRAGFGEPVGDYTQAGPYIKQCFGSFSATGCEDECPVQRSHHKVYPTLLRLFLHMVFTWWKRGCTHDDRLRVSTTCLGE